ncbi:PTS N-acetylglucosamine transporter subunit IIBC [Tsukamurella sputi]|uniref:PTS N-acetylglucosamine transporter subunit IIBC n=1 Tax=Tsukamurella sputi TaxID=2591848 RepID=A0A5C5RK82_9ACTN|nr:PTS transporter subunit EIIC [Tsukamurella sputi]TWS22994.1 PTS N-acetylglucosamine transporter subunit IIBC [Tsukamurella sputi]
MSSSSGSGISARRLDLSGLQKLGRSLMLPIAVLPAAGILLRLGQDDLLGRFSSMKTVAAVIGGAGNALFANLGMLFAVGIAIGWAKKADGSTALAALVGYLSFQAVEKAMSPVVLAGKTDKDGAAAVVEYGVLGGIVIGIMSAVLWQRYYKTKLPDYIGFFSGRRLVPILTASGAIVVGVLMSFLYPAFNWALTGLANWVAEHAVVGGGVYGTINRLLLPLGLHHIINSVVWFVLGDYKGANGTVVHGDIARFMQGDPTAGNFMTGFFPIMMFALPAAALAIYRCAKPENRKVVGGIMLSVGLTSFLTGITEPLEFSFIFVAWPLLLVHAVLTGTSHMLVNWLDIHHGFTFSAGAIDYVLNFGLATKPLLLIPIGLMYAVIYYFSFTFIIKRWNLKTPGREDEDEEAEATA